MKREWLIWILAGLAHVTMWVALRLGWLDPLFNDSMHRFGPACDFFAIYQAGLNARQGASIYQWQIGKIQVPYAYPFRYLPMVAYTVGGVLSLMPPLIAYAVWLGICEVVLLRNAELSYHLAGKGARGAAIAAIWLTFFPLFLEFWVGQFTFILGSLLFYCVLALEKQRISTSAVIWIASILFKPASLLWAPLWMRSRKLMPVVPLALAVVAADSLGYFTFAPADWRLFCETNFTPLPTWHAGNIGLQALLFAVGGEQGYTPLRWLSLVLVLVPALLVTFRPKELRAPDWLLGAMWTTVYFLIYKDVWEHHLTMLLPFLVLGLIRAPSKLLVAVTAMLALPSLFILYDHSWLVINEDPQPYFSQFISLFHHSWRVVPLLALFCHWIVRAARCPRNVGSLAGSRRSAAPYLSADEAVSLT